MKAKEELNAKALTDEKLTGVHGGIKVILTDKLSKMQEILKKMMQIKKERKSRN